MNALILAGHALVDGGQAINAEQLAFWQSRLKEDLATGQRLLECGSAENAWQIQLEYAQSALQAYVDQSTKVAGLIAHALTDSLLPQNARGGAEPLDDRARGLISGRLPRSRPGRDHPSARQARSARREQRSRAPAR